MNNSEFSEWVIFDGILCIEYQTLIGREIIKKDNLIKKIQRGQITRVVKSFSRKKNLIHFNSLEETYKIAVINSIGKPPVIESISTNAKKIDYIRVTIQQLQQNHEVIEQLISMIDKLKD